MAEQPSTEKEQLTGLKEETRETPSSSPAGIQPPYRAPALRDPTNVPKPLGVKPSGIGKVIPCPQAPQLLTADGYQA